MPLDPHNKPLRRVRVELGPRSYEAIVGSGLFARVGEHVRATLGSASKHAAIVADSSLPAELVDSAGASLRQSGFLVSTVQLDAAERNKSVREAERICTHMASARMERQDPVIAIGGGIVGDVAGFAASMYRRGVPVIQCPTTLLAMVDASIGGKTGANLEVPNADGTTSLLKNLVGAFHQPSLVLADVACLGSLPIRHLRAGMAECLKHALIARDVEQSGTHETDLFQQTTDIAHSLTEPDKGAMIDLIARNLAVKARVVESDEHERSTAEVGGRAILNLGHTFAHAIETLSNLSPDGDPSNCPLHHGEAVGLGLVAAAHAAAKLGTLDQRDASRIRGAVAALGLPDRIAGLPDNQSLLARMHHDKKVSAGRLRLILPHGLGHARSHFDPPVPVIEAGWNAVRA
ncbi:MAG: 3-dehydroquinate synthase [Phycisphaeraceae bacterium]|nr:3-dehydroquinate synthase [Phycisphaeraceae bacterium]